MCKMVAFSGQGRSKEVTKNKKSAAYEDPCSDYSHLKVFWVSDK